MKSALEKSSKFILWDRILREVQKGKKNNP